MVHQRPNAPSRHPGHRPCRLWNRHNCSKLPCQTCSADQTNPILSNRSRRSLGNFPCLRIFRCVWHHPPKFPFRRFRETPIFSDKRLQLLVVLHPFPLEVLIPDKADLIQSPDALFAQTSILPSFPLGITPGRKRAVFTFGPASAGIKEDFNAWYSLIHLESS